MEFVYIGKGDRDSAYKIGRTGKLLDFRVGQHRTSNPSFSCEHIFETARGIELEKLLHQLFRIRRKPDTKEWFYLTSEDLIRAKEFANRFDQELVPLRASAEVFQKGVVNGEFLRASDDAVEDHRRLLQIEEQIAWLEVEKQALRWKLMKRIGFSAGVEGLVRWSFRNQLRFDSYAFKKEHGALFNQFRQPVSQRCFWIL